jgi:hypothetical protein
MTIPIYCGFDPREAVGYHVFCQSVIERASEPVAFIPLHRPLLRNFDGQRDGSNAFIYSRYLPPYLMGFNGWAIFADGSDMVCLDDIAELWRLKDESKAVMVVQHDYQTQHPRKYLETPMEADNVSYPRKNWSSLILWNCGHISNRILTREFVAEAGGKFLHRFEWLKDDLIGRLPLTWNWLVGEYEDNINASLLHHTLGIPAFREYARPQSRARPWQRTLLNALHAEGEDASAIVKRASTYGSIK